MLELELELYVAWKAGALPRGHYRSQGINVVFR